MPLPRPVARFNRAILNHLTRPLARYVPGFGVVVHRRRTSGHTYRTPVNVFRYAGGFVIALTYGPGSDWVRNVLASGGCVLETGGRDMPLTRRRLVHDEQRRALPWLPRVVGVLGHVADFLCLSFASPESDAAVR